jgi:hypothetical protein
MAHDPSMEHVEEHIHHEAAHGGGPNWIGLAALTAAIIAALAASAGMLAGLALTESNRDQAEANNKYAYFQSKSIKQSLLQSKDDILVAIGKEAPRKDTDKLAEYERDKDKILAEAKEKEESSKHHLHVHETIEGGVTMFHVAIAVVAVSVLSKRKTFFYASLGFAAIGLVFGVMGMKEMFGHGGGHEPEKGNHVVNVAPAPATPGGVEPRSDERADEHEHGKSTTH